MICVRVPATTANLGPGFDTLGMALSLYNYVEMDLTSEPDEIMVDGEGGGTIATTADNIVYRAARQVFDAAGVNPGGLKIRLRNHIPLARGLGSSAAALVGGVIAANCLIGNPLSEQKLIELAAGLEGHPDNVAPAFLGGVVVATQANNRLYCHKIQPIANLRAIVAIPQFFLSTKKARDILPRQVAFTDAVFNISRATMLVASLINQDLDLFGKMMDDRLHQPYRVTLIPGMEEVFAAAREAGAVGVALSGAGPTLIAFARDSCADIGKAMASAFRIHGIESTVQVLTPTTEGATILTEESGVRSQESE